MLVDERGRDAHTINNVIEAARADGEAIFLKLLGKQLVLERRSKDLKQILHKSKLQASADDFYTMFEASCR